MRYLTVKILKSVIPLLVAASCSPDPNSAASREVDAVSYCDTVVQSTLVARNSYNAATPWNFIDMGKTGYVRREFDATNAFGGTISSSYECSYNYEMRVVTMLRIEKLDGGWNQIIGPKSR